MNKKIFILIVSLILLLWGYLLWSSQKYSLQGTFCYNQIYISKKNGILFHYWTGNVSHIAISESGNTITVNYDGTQQYVSIFDNFQRLSLTGFLQQVILS